MCRYSAKASGAYYYSGGWNPAALWALAAGVAPTLPGFLANMQASAMGCCFKPLPRRFTLPGQHAGKCHTCTQLCLV